jgi:hypothetical protein
MTRSGPLISPLPCTWMPLIQLTEHLRRYSINRPSSTPSTLVSMEVSPLVSNYARFG